MWGVWEGIWVYIWLIHFVVQKKLTQYCKAIIIKKEKGKKKYRFNIILPTEVQIVKAMVFLIIKHGCELDDEECRLSTEELMLPNSGARGLLRVPWIVKRSN